MNPRFHHSLYAFGAVALTAISLPAQTNVFPSSGNVGIGTTSPAEPLSLQTSAFLTAHINGSSGTGTRIDLESQSSGVRYQIQAIGSGLSGRVGNFEIQNYNSGAVPFTITSGGNVGINMSNPQYPLDIAGAGARVSNGNGNAAQLDLVQTNGGHDWALVSWGSAAGGGGLSNKFSIYDNTAGGHRLIVDASGNVGVGTADVGARLHVYGSGFAGPNGSNVPFMIEDPTGVSGHNKWGFGTRIGDNSLAIQDLVNGATRLYVDGTGKVGIGTTNPSQPLEVAGQIMANVAGGGSLSLKGSNSNSQPLIYFERASGAVWLAGLTSDASASFFINNGYGGGNVMTMLPSGNVGIGTTNPTQKLSVNGTIQAKEVVVQTGWSDYVFADDYRLAPLSEVEARIKAEKHLPGIPSAAEVAEHGVSIGDVQSKLLAKIEELTLHVIAQDKELRELRARDDARQAQDKALRELMTLNQELLSRLNR